MKYVKSFEQYNTNESIKDTAHELIDGATSVLYAPKRRILKLLNNIDTTEIEMRELIVDLFKLDSKGQKDKLEAIYNMNYNQLLQLLSKILNTMEYKMKKPNLILKNNTLSLTTN